MLYKNLPADIRGKSLFTRRLLDTIAWFKFVATFQFGNAGAILKAHRDYRKMMPEMKVAGAAENLIEKKGRIFLWKYYLKGLKTFDKLSTAVIIKLFKQALKFF